MLCPTFSLAKQHAWGREYQAKRGNISPDLFTAEQYLLVITNLFEMEYTDNSRSSAAVLRNGRIFGVLSLVFHTLACFMFGFFFKLPSALATNVDAVYIAFAHGVLVVIGFGLLFSFLRKMLWSGLGFALLITALSIQMYFMMNAFWTKATIAYTNNSLNVFSQSDKTYNFFLTNLIEPTRNAATIAGAFKCALSNLVAFSAIIGRAGPLEAFIVVIFGTIGYELNRQIIENYTNDSGGANAIFVFGGFMGLVIGLFRYLRERNPETTTAQNQNYTGDRTSVAFTLIGTLLTWIFFPVLALDYIDPVVASHTPYTGAYNVIFSLCAATLTSFMVSPLLNNGVVVRDIIYGPIAGGVASVTASYWIINPTYALVIGVVSALVQVLVMNLVEKKVAQEKSIFNTYSFSLFGLQGMIGAIFAAIWQAGLRSRTQNFTINFNTNQVFAWIASLISLPMGLAFGILIGVFVMLAATHKTQDHFDDFTYWINDDGIRDLDLDSGQQVYYNSEPVQREERERVKGQQTYL